MGDPTCVQWHPQVLMPQQPPAQEALHVAATVCNQLHDDTSFLNSIDQPVRLEKDLSKPGDAKIGKLARMAPALREFCKAGQRLLDAVEDIGGTFLCIVLRDVAADVIQVAQGVVREDNAEGHQPTYFLRREAMARSEEHTSEIQSLMRISYAVL